MFHGYVSMLLLHFQNNFQDQVFVVEQFRVHALKYVVQQHDLHVTFFICTLHEQLV